MLVFESSVLLRSPDLSLSLWVQGFGDDGLSWGRQHVRSALHEDFCCVFQPQGGVCSWWGKGREWGRGHKDLPSTGGELPRVGQEWCVSVRFRWLFQHLEVLGKLQWDHQANCFSLCFYSFRYFLTFPLELRCNVTLTCNKRILNMPEFLFNLSWWLQFTF